MGMGTHLLHTHLERILSLDGLAVQLSSVGRHQHLYMYRHGRNESICIYVYMYICIYVLVIVLVYVLVIVLVYVLVIVLVYVLVIVLVYVLVIVLVVIGV
jgi:hypothetical protein